MDELKDYLQKVIGVIVDINGPNSVVTKEMVDVAVGVLKENKTHTLEETHPLERKHSLHK